MKSIKIIKNTFKASIKIILNTTYTITRRLRFWYLLYLSFHHTVQGAV